MGFIRERRVRNGTTRFQAEIRLKGHRMMTAVFDRKLDAKAWIYKTEADIRCRRQNLYEEIERHTFKEAVARYFKEQPITTAKRGHLEWWNTELGSFYLQDIRSSVIHEKKQKLLSERNKKGKIRTKSTCNRFLATLSHLMNVCLKQWEWLSENPVKKVSREKEPPGRTRFLKPDERERLFEACKESDNPHLLTFVVCLLGSGARYNEVRSLKTSDFNAQKGTLTFRRTKNSIVHSVPVRGLPLKLLKGLCLKKSPNEYLFPGKDPSKPIEFRRAMRTALRRAGLNDVTPHIFRHTYCTELLSMGVALAEVSLLLNHKAVATTKRYGHLVESRSIQVVTELSERIFQEVKNG